MLGLIVIGLVIIGAIWFYFYMTLDKPKLINLKEPVQLRFVKGESWDEYYVQFFNPAYNQWWTLPELSAGIHEPWSFQTRGSYGAYDLNMMKACTNEIPYIKNEYKTLADIEAYMVRLREKYNDFQVSERKDRSRPNVIY